MKRIFCFIMLSLLMGFTIQAQTKVKEIRSGGIQIIREETPAPPQQTRVVFWTSQERQGPIKVYVNGRYEGKITKSYRSAPKCGASGCVTVTISGKNNQWYGVASDGTRWYSSSATLSRGCNAIRLYSSGGSSSSRSRGSSSSHSSSGGTVPKGNPGGDAISSSVQKMGDAYGSIMREGMSVPVEGFPYFAVNAGYSRFSSGFIGLKYRTGGFCGLSLFGDFGFLKSDYGYPWDVGFGLCIKDFAWDLRFGNTGLCPNYGLMTDISYDWYFTEKFGVSAIVGLGLGDTKKNDPDLIWTWGISFSYKIWNR